MSTTAADGWRQRNEALMLRTRRFALAIVNFVRGLPRDQVAAIIGRQLLRSGTSVGANYRSACRARSKPDFIAKMKIVEEEADESLYWLELLAESGISGTVSASPLTCEAEELVRIAVASINTARANQTRGE